MRNVAFDGQSLITSDLFAKSIPQGRDIFDNDQYEYANRSMLRILNQAETDFKNGRTPSAIIQKTAAELHFLRNGVSKNIWQTIIPMAQEHSVASYFLQDPFTKWSFTKPRGYSGDAGLLDFIYGHPSVENQIARSTDLGKDLYDYTKDASSSVAVRERRDILTRYVDRVVADQGGGSEILTIAAGHLREANSSIALSQNQISRWVALDQDPNSVEAIKEGFPNTSIQPIEGSVRGLLANKYKLGKFDYIYAAGLYDYLADKVAIKLTQACLKMLKPNGLFLFANFAQDIGVDGYMETFMNWPLLLRSESDMRNIIDGSTGDTDVKTDVFFGENRNIVYGTIRIP